MRTIHKYDVTEGFSGVTLDLPACARLLHFADQNGRLSVWFEVNDEAGLVKRTYQIFGTGWIISAGKDEMEYRATCQQERYVWHLYEKL